MSVSRMFSQEIVSSVFFATLPSEELAGTGWLSHNVTNPHTPTRHNVSLDSTIVPKV